MKKGEGSKGNQVALTKTGMPNHMNLKCKDFENSPNDNKKILASSEESRPARRR